MKQIFKNIILIPMAIFTLLLSMGMHVTKIQCAKGERVFVGTDVSTCKMQEKTTSCCMKKKLVKSCINSEKENKPQKESKLLQFDFETEKCKCGEPVDFSVSLPFLTLLFENYKISKSELFTINHYADVPPLVNKPILSQIQSFLL
jgi:hypothetical protein